MAKTKITYRGSNKVPQKDIRKSMNFFEGTPSMEDGEYKKYMNKSEYAFMYITDENIYPICKLWYKRFPFLMLEPNPVTFYYSLALDSYEQSMKLHSVLRKILESPAEVDKKSSDMVVAYSMLFKVSSVCVIFSFLAIEAFMNQELPQNGPVKMNSGKDKTKESIERWATFDQKMDKILPEINGINFTIKYPNHRKVIGELKNLRDDLTHLKQKKGSGITRYEELYQSVLKVDLKKYINAAKKFINFYHKGLIVNYQYRATPASSTEK